MDSFLRSLFSHLQAVYSSYAQAAAWISFGSTLRSLARDQISMPMSRVAPVFLLTLLCYTSMGHCGPNVTAWGIGTNWFSDKTNQWNSWSAISSENTVTSTLSVDFVHRDKSARPQWTTTCFSIPTPSFPNELWKSQSSEIHRKMLASNSTIPKKHDLGFCRQKRADCSVCSSVWILAFWVTKPTMEEGCPDILPFFRGLDLLWLMKKTTGGPPNVFLNSTPLAT